MSCSPSGTRRRSWFSRMPHVRLLLEELERVVVVARARTPARRTSRAASPPARASTAAVEAEDAAVRALRIGGERLVERLARRRADRRAARVVVLDDRRRRAARTRSTSRRPESRSSRLLNDSSLPCSFDTIDSRCVRAPACGVVGRALVRVLAVGEVEHLLERRACTGPGSRPRARRTSARSPRRSARCRRTPRSRALSRVRADSLPLALAQLLEHRVVALRRDHHGRERRGSSPPRGSASGRRCRCSRSPRASSTPRACATRARTDRGSRRPGRSARSRAR